jgi:hypothetical protein
MPKTLTVCLLFFIMQFASSQNYNCIVKRYYENITINNSQLTVNESIILQINNKAGDKYSIFHIPYSKNCPINDINAHIELPDGTIVRQLKNKEIVKKSNITDFSLYEDDYVKEFSLQHNVYPYIIKIEYSYTLRDYCQIADWTPFYKKALPVEDAKLEIKAPKELKLNISNASNIKQNTTPHENQVSYIWQTSYTPLKKEELAPSSTDLIPRILVTTDKFHWKIDGQCDTWQNFGLWQYNLNKGSDNLPPTEISKVHTLTEHLTNPYDKVKTLYQYLQQNKRYINVSIKYGGLQTYPAEYVCNNGYGDCKALSNYMKALLKEAGIRAIYTIVNAGEENEQIDTTIPCPQFNHIIICIPQGKDTCWLECTSKYNPTGYLGSFTQNRTVLLVDENGGKLAKTPALEAQECQENKYTTVDASTHMATVKMQLCGPNFEYINSIQNDAPSNYHEYILDKYLFPALDVKEWKFIHYDNQPKIGLEVKGEIQSSSTGNGTSLIYSPHSINIPKLEKVDARTLPVEIPYPILINDTLKVKFPTQYKSIENTPDSKIEEIWGFYSRKIQLNKSELIIIRQLYLKAGIISLEKYKNFYAFIQQIKRLDKDKLIMKQ